MRKLFKGGNYLLLGGFDCGNYSREETIQGRKLFIIYGPSVFVNVFCFVYLLKIILLDFYK